MPTAISTAMDKHEKYISECYQLAERSVHKGNHPFGALLLLHDQVVLKAENTIATDRDITRHAEMNLVSKAVQNLSVSDLGKAILYTSTEPCAMCTGAIYWAGIRNIVYGCSAQQLGKIAGATFVVPCKDLLVYGEEPTTITGPLLEKQGADLHQNFWPKLSGNP